ncbi:MAG TPA: peroxide stress protein YaaA [Bacteroidales bacterium]|nr:peroxide stress protein YaaA [Bacteroidales bacterium]
MMIIISPAKTLDYEREVPDYKGSKIRFAREASELAELLRGHSEDELVQLMKISEPLARLNAERYLQWQWPFKQADSRAALFAFKGDVYNGMDALSMEPGSVDYAQESLRILSGLYGLLRPLDEILPYRLEMGSRLKNAGGKDLYAFWGDKLSRQLDKDIQEGGHRFLVNLASQEYFSAIDPQALSVPVVSPVFKDFKNGKYKILSFYAKKARGLMTRYIIENRLTSPEELKAFNLDGYGYNEELSAEENSLVFTRD